MRIDVDKIAGFFNSHQGKREVKEALNKADKFCEQPKESRKITVEDLQEQITI